MKYKKCTEELKADKKQNEDKFWKGLYIPFEGGGAWSHLKEGIPLELFFFFFKQRK